MSILDRRIKREPPELDITAFLNLMVILIPFLLITAVFSQITIIELNLPPPSSDPSQPQKEELELEVIIRADALEVADSKGGLIKRIEPTAPGAHDFKALSDLLQELKKRFPNKTNAMVLAEKDTSYDTLVHVMDATRLVEVLQGGSLVQAELFPDIAIGDAPAAQTQKK